MQKHSTAHGAVSVSADDAARDARHHCDQYGDRRSYALTQSAADVDLYIHADSPDDLNALAGRLNELAHTWRIALGTVPSPLPPPTTSSVTDDAPAHGIERPATEYHAASDVIDLVLGVGRQIMDDREHTTEDDR